MADAARDRWDVDKAAREAVSGCPVVHVRNALALTEAGIPFGGNEGCACQSCIAAFGRAAYAEGQKDRDRPQHTLTCGCGCRRQEGLRRARALVVQWNHATAKSRFWIVRAPK